MFNFKQFEGNPRVDERRINDNLTLFEEKMKSIATCRQYEAFGVVEARVQFTMRRLYVVDGMIRRGFFIMPQATAAREADIDCSAAKLVNKDDGHG